MNVIRLMLEDNNRKLLDVICTNIVSSCKKLDSELQPVEKSRALSGIKFSNEIAVRCFLRDTRYATLALNCVNNTLVIYKGVRKCEDKYWQPTQVYKTIYNLPTLGNDEKIEEVAQIIDEILDEPIIIPMPEDMLDNQEQE